MCGSTCVEIVLFVRTAFIHEWRLYSRTCVNKGYFSQYVSPPAFISGSQPPLILKRTSSGAAILELTISYAEEYGIRLIHGIRFIRDYHPG